jgi:hypothetical protein
MFGSYFPRPLLSVAFAALDRVLSVAFVALDGVLSVAFVALGVLLVFALFALAPGGDGSYSFALTGSSTGACAVRACI